MGLNRFAIQLRLTGARGLKVALLTWVCACSDGGQTPSASQQVLAARDAWTLDAAGDDPLVEHRQGAKLCGVEALRVEPNGFEVSTETCDYVSLSQRTERQLMAGDTLAFSVWWATLAALEPSQAHLALLLEGQLIWEDSVAIPGEADVREVELLAPAPAERNSRLTFHLHNHGANTWKIGDIGVVRR